MTKKTTKKKPKDKRGKWSRDPWIRILYLLAEMGFEERHRCIKATLAFFDGR